MQYYFKLRRAVRCSFSADSKLAFIALKDKKLTAVVDTKLKKIVSHYQAGLKPKRNIVTPLL